jgi:hypothetical protein
MKKSNNKVSQHKIKRATKNKKRIQSKPYLSRFERKQAFLREQIILGALQQPTKQNES